MKLDYFLDVSDDSSSAIHTPSLASQQLPFYVYNCGHFHSGPGYYTEREELDNYLLVYTVSGSGFLKYRGQEYSIKPRQIFFINCYEYHLYKTGVEGCWEIMWVHLNGSACKSYFDLINGDCFNIVSLSNPKDIVTYLNEMPMLSIRSDIYSDVTFSKYLTDILSEMVMNKLNPVNSRNFDRYNQMIDSVISFLQAEYKKKVNTHDMVELVHLSEYHFLRIFKKYTGLSPYEYLINYRINKSKSLLKETNLSVNEIAYEVGFNNINNFIRDFKKLVGVSPLKYRNYWPT